MLQGEILVTGAYSTWKCMQCIPSSISSIPAVLPLAVKVPAAYLSIWQRQQRMIREGGQGGWKGATKQAQGSTAQHAPVFVHVHKPGKPACGCYRLTSTAMADVRMKTVSYVT